MEEQNIQELEDDISKIDKEIDNIAYDYYGESVDNESEAEEYEKYINDPVHLLDELSKKKEKKEDELLKRKIDIENKNYSKMYIDEKSKYKKGTPYIDKETSVDLLSRRTYAKIIAEYIVNSKTETPFNIGIFGEWGEGKSSFLKLIEDELKNEGEIRTHIIKYDATEYNEQYKIWACILKQLFNEYERENGLWGRIKFSFYRFIKNIKISYWKYAIRIISLLLVVGWWFIINNKAINFKNINSIVLVSSLGAIPIIMSIVNVIVPFIKNQISITKPLSDLVVSNIELPNYTKQLGHKETIKEDLNDLLDVWLHSKEAERKDTLVICIDELDRCSEEGILELLEALQLFLSIKQKVVIIMAVNINSVCNALSKKMQYVGEDKQTIEDKIKFTISYLEKYINIPVYLQYNGDYEEYLRNMMMNHIDSNANLLHEGTKIVKTLNNKDYDNNLVFNDDEKELIKNIIRKVNSKKHITPREVKRILNILILCKEVCITINDKNLYNEKMKFSNYIRWFFFSYFNSKISYSFQRKIVKQKSYYSIQKVCSINQTIRDIILGCNMYSLIKDIRVREIEMFKNISNYFILDIEKYDLINTNS